MNKTQEALKLALEALESVKHKIDSYQVNVCDDVDEAITAIREALAEQPAQQQEPGRSCNDAYELIMKWADIYAAQTGRIYSEAAQDPTKTAKMADERTMLACAVAQALSQPAQQQEPVAWATRMGEYAHIHWGAKRPEYPMVYGVPLYTFPPASKPLKDEELRKLADKHLFYQPEGYEVSGMFAFARAIEAKLKEKNNG